MGFGLRRHHSSQPAGERVHHLEAEVVGEGDGEIFCLQHREVAPVVTAVNSGCTLSMMDIAVDAGVLNCVRKQLPVAVRPRK